MQGWRSGESTRLPPLGPGFNFRLGIICGLSLLVPFSAVRGFSPGTLVFPSPQKPTFNLIYIKDVRANCFCASLLRTQMHTPRHTRARALSNKMRNGRAKGHCYSFACIKRSWTFGDPNFSFQKRILFTIISTLSKNEQKINVGS